MPRPVLHQDALAIAEENVEVEVKSGVVTVAGPRGSLTRDFRHLTLDLEWQAGPRRLVARCWFGNRKMTARCGTLFGHVKNMVTGVTQGYRYKMRFVTAHFPIKHTISAEKNEFGFTHFMGQRENKRITAQAGVTIGDSRAGQKDEIWVEGCDKDAVALTCAQIHQSTHIRNKDLRKFLDGIYVSERGHIAE